jgi:hypothetical protein
MNQFKDSMLNIFGRESYDAHENGFVVDANIVVGAVVYGDAKVTLKEDDSPLVDGLIIKLPEMIPGAYPQTEYDLRPTLVEKELPITLLQAIEIRNTLQKSVQDIESLIHISNNKDFTEDVKKSIKDLHTHARRELEKLENKFRTIQI